MISFEELGLKENLLEAIKELGFERPMPIQAEVIPYLLEADRDVVALAQTGTGKTAAFGLPVLHKIDIENVAPQALILCPTRELCLQIAGDLQDFAKYMPELRIQAVYGGASIKNQIDGLKRGAHIIVATPGRLLDLGSRGVADLSAIRYVVMDEADEMLNMGFLEDIDAILAAVPEERNTMLFSATMPEEIGRLSMKYMKEPKEIVIGNRNEGTSSVRHIYYMVQAKDKYNTLKRIVDYYPRIYGIIFCRTKVETQEIADKLIHDGYSADSLHGDLSQAQRDYVMRRFRLHNIQLLVATDVAARGIDVDDLTHIINYTLPDETEIYTHRSGRTGRAGKTGISIAIINLREKGRIRRIEKAIGKTFEQGKIPTGKEICSKQIFNLVDRIEKVVVNEDDIAEVLPGVVGRLSWMDREELVKRLVSMEFNRLLAYYRDNEDFEAAKEQERKEVSKRLGKHVEVPVTEGYSKLFINIGRMDGAGAKNILGMICSCVEGKVDVGRIDIFTRYCLFDVANENAPDVIRELSTLKMKGRAIRVDLATEEQIKRGNKKAGRRDAAAKVGNSGGAARTDRKKKEDQQ